LIKHFGVINELAFGVCAVAIKHGFWPIRTGGSLMEAADKAFAEKIALIHSEASEALEVHRAGHGFATWYREDGKPEGVGPELADVIIRCLDLANACGINIEKEIDDKAAFNATRPFKHGKSY
jgi:NTP pyrophosphatase (non-canonical NTP hydrolase)